MKTIDIDVLKEINGDEAIREYIDLLNIEDVKSFNSANNINNYNGGERTIMFTIINEDIQGNKGMFDEYFN